MAVTRKSRINWLEDVCSIGMKPSWNLHGFPYLFPIPVKPHLQPNTASFYRIPPHMASKLDNCRCLPAAGVDAKTNRAAKKVTFSSSNMVVKFGGEGACTGKKPGKGKRGKESDVIEYTN